MLYTDTKKKALETHEKAVDKYNRTYEKVNKESERLYNKRKESIRLIARIEKLINSIANSPKEFITTLSHIEAERTIFRDTETYATDAYETAVKSGMSAAAGVAGGMAFAGMAPTAAMWAATTFGTASTGAAISTLTGAAAQKAALAWLGGGALSAGGAGMAGGQALLALAGPIGWGITGVTTVASVALLGRKNKKVSRQAIEEAKKVSIAGALLNESAAEISFLIEKTTLLMEQQEQAYDQIKHLENADYEKLSYEVQLRLGALVNNTLSLAEMLNKTVE